MNEGPTSQPVGSDAQDEDRAQELNNTKEGCHTLQSKTALGHHGGASVEVGCCWVEEVRVGADEETSEEGVAEQKLWQAGTQGV